MTTTAETPFRMEMDPNKLDSKIKSFEYNGNNYLYICHLNVYSGIPGGHEDDRPDQVKFLVKSFYGKYIDMVIPLMEFDTSEFYATLSNDINKHLISTESSY
ncbi:hypothetical protein [Pedobacter sp. MC2016-24]|uniref:hypothetical protein n=1 Tax=Pedobacter sp. MC2016-24 TaxID=2780090 RepID=UPI0018816029|nr:hypothetical protein [Pedobacter sp. MC2016-24]MBE9599806.1 hypothetical protein [Pedobacter sp. MC2016-24]